MRLIALSLIFASPAAFAMEDAFPVPESAESPPQVLPFCDPERPEYSPIECQHVGELNVQWQGTIIEGEGAHPEGPYLGGGLIGEFGVAAGDGENQLLFDYDGEIVGSLTLAGPVAWVGVAWSDTIEQEVLVVTTGSTAVVVPNMAEHSELEVW